jgi:hypothetical protein
VVRFTSRPLHPWGVADTHQIRRCVGPTAGRKNFELAGNRTTISRSLPDRTAVARHDTASGGRKRQCMLPEVTSSHSLLVISLHYDSVGTESNTRPMTLRVPEGGGGGCSGSVRDTESLEHFTECGPDQTGQDLAARNLLLLLLPGEDMRIIYFFLTCG